MTIRQFFLAILITFFFISMSGCSSSVKPPSTVSQVDLHRYMGRWYEIASFPNYFQKGCQCTTATYGFQGESVRVQNQCYRGSPLKLSKATGKAWPADASNAKLKVQFFWPFRGDYWILYVDPDYRMALVGSPNYDYLWILSRTPTITAFEYQQLVAIAQDKGYHTENLQKTQQLCAGGDLR